GERRKTYRRCAPRASSENSTAEIPQSLPERSQSKFAGAGAVPSRDRTPWHPSGSYAKNIGNRKKGKSSRASSACSGFGEAAPRWRISSQRTLEQWRRYG